MEMHFINNSKELSRPLGDFFSCFQSYTTTKGTALPKENLKTNIQLSKLLTSLGQLVLR